MAAEFEPGAISFVTVIKDGEGPSSALEVGGRAWKKPRVDRAIHQRMIILSLTQRSELRGAGR